MSNWMFDNSSYEVKNILIISSSSSKTGGGDIHLNRLISYWQKDNVDVKTLTLMEFNKFDLLTNVKYAFTSLEKIIGLNNVTNEEILKFDIIVSASPYPSDLFHSIKLGKKYGKKVVCYFHHIVPPLSNYPFRRGFFRTVLNIVYFKYALHLVKKNHVAIFLDHPETLKDSGITVYENLTPAEGNDNVYRDKFYDICHIGRITKAKGIIDLIRVLKMLSEEGIKPKIALVGAYSSKMKTKLDKLIHKYGLEGQITFFGYVNNEKKVEILKSSKIFISLSYEEGWSISVMEAANYGIPIIAYDLVAYNYLHGNYHSVPVGNLIVVKSLIINLLSNTELLNKYVESATFYVKSINYEDVSKTQLKYMSDFLNRVD